ncbi:Ovoinhibitor [Phytophthora citrophthora]|uniref:Ovoinhibitor n=1 Tax=Phytophthora citrophthora TaxID=4793 RepID=A0AAD9LDG7_9STRA|nr:Ovoinhibitor [Phytophthora citrophthora]
MFEQCERFKEDTDGVHHFSIRQVVDTIMKFAIRRVLRLLLRIPTLKTVALSVLHVCGSDDITYWTPCDLDLANCHAHGNITPVSIGACPTTGSTSSSRTTCGETTICLLIIAIASTQADNVDQQQQQSPYSTAASNSTDDCSYACTDVYEPVCGSDGVTYSNECYLTLANCEAQEQIAQVSDGKCPSSDSTSQTSSYESSVDNSGSTACPDMCPAVYEPVCGSDGKTYANACTLSIASCENGGSITQVSDGQCPSSSTSTSSYESGVGCPEVCIEIYDPVCGTDGVTYANSCFLGIANCKNSSITQASDGVCIASEGSNQTSNPSQEGSVGGESSSPSSASSACPSICNTLYAPVCGSDGVTYGNDCELEVASCESPEKHIIKVSDGACGAASSTTQALSPPEETTICPFMCSDQHLPVCGSDGVTYTNDCYLLLADCENPESITKVHDGECEVIACPTCTDENLPVCGSDGVTYMNDCFLLLADCENPESITKVHDGECEVIACPICTDENLPVCGSDGVTYMNDCFLLLADCENPESITKVHDGECEVIACPICTDENLPVCGSDGVTYMNDCFLLLADCENPESITKVHDGECEVIACPICTDENLPVCGSDGVTYMNDCFLLLADCENPESITKVHDGECEVIACPICTDENLPVCGSDGVTYMNDCFLLLADCENPESITKVHDGECGITTYPSTNGSGSTECSDVCPAIYQPVCGSDGVTYSNDCVLNYVTCTSGGAITQVSEGECLGSSNSGTSEEGSAGSSGCMEVCIEIWRPVCGSDGVSYANSCFMGIATCKDPSITQVHTGVCGSTSDEGSSGSTPSTDSSGSTGCSDVCIEIWRPVCGSDGVTYPNSCFLGIESCKNPDITQVHEGECETTGGSEENGGNESNNTSTDSSQETTSNSGSSCPSVCLAIYSPVCGSDGITYGNECKLDVESCNHSELHLTKAYDGACTPVECKTG